MTDQRDLQYRIYYLEDQISEIVDEDEIEQLELEIEECERQLAILERAADDECKYDSWEEVFTGGDY